MASKPKGTKHIVGFSGGIDSQACARVVLDLFPEEDVILTNSNAGGNEHWLTDQHVDWYDRNVHPIVRTNAIVADMWATEGFAETKGLNSNAPLTFEEMIRIKGRPPARKAQFCTEKLKLQPQRRWIRWAFGPMGPYEGWDFIRYSGVRRDESAPRRNQEKEQWDEYYDCVLRCPIADWSKKMCFDYVINAGEEINPLYKLGFNRVGCSPCVNSSKEDIRLLAQRSPEIIDRVRGMEQRTGRTFFAPCVPGKITNNIDEVVAWAMTSRGGKETVFSILDERPTCESKYGLCE